MHSSSSFPSLKPLQKTPLNTKTQPDRHHRQNKTKKKKTTMSRIGRHRFLPHLPIKRPPPTARSLETLASADPPNPTPKPTPTPTPAGGSRLRTVLKVSASAAVAAAIGAVGYASFAYDLEELEKVAGGLRPLANYSVGDEASSFEKFQATVYSTAYKVPLKTIELYIDTRRAIEEHVRGFTEPSSEKLLPDLHPQESHVYTLVLDLNETLVYSDWTRERGWRTFKRPGVDAFLEHLAKFYEIVVYSDQLSMYVDPVIERLDPKGCIRYRLARNATLYQNGKHYRDLSKLNRDPSRVLYVSAHALESSLQPENSLPIKPWKLENNDTALLDLIPFLEYVAVHRPADIRTVLASYQGRDIASEFIERSREHQRRMQEQKQQGGFWRRRTSQ